MDLRGLCLYWVFIGSYMDAGVSLRLRIIAGHSFFLYHYLGGSNILLGELGNGARAQKTRDIKLLTNFNSLKRGYKDNR